ncbi:MAG: hypothetical protein ACK58T_23780, partial [Phycisphaerae bacterium]
MTTKTRTSRQHTLAFGTVAAGSVLACSLLVGCAGGGGNSRPAGNAETSRAVNDVPDAPRTKQTVADQALDRAQKLLAQGMK